MISLEKLKDHLIQKEDLKLEAYKLPGESNYTIGVGHHGADVKKGMKITEEEAEQLLEKDIQSKLKLIERKLPNFNDYSENLQKFVVDGFFRGDLSGSPKTLKLLKQGNFEEASQEFLRNEEYNEAVISGSGVASRMEDISEAMRKESDASFEGTTSREDGREAVPLPMMKPKREDDREAVPMPMENPIDDTQKMLINEESPRKFKDIPPQIEAPEDRTLIPSEEEMEETPTGDNIFSSFFSSLGDLFDSDDDEDVPMPKEKPTFKEGGSVEEVDFVKEKSEKNDPPPGATPEEVADDIPAMLSEGEYVLPANVVKYIGLERIMDMHRGVLREIQQMEDLGMIQNVDENGKPEDDDKEMTFLEPEEGVMQETIIIAGKPKDGMMCPPKLNEGAAINRNVDIGDLRENIAIKRGVDTELETYYDDALGLITYAKDGEPLAVMKKTFLEEEKTNASSEDANDGVDQFGVDMSEQETADLEAGMSDTDTDVQNEDQQASDPAETGAAEAAEADTSETADDDSGGGVEGNKGGLMQRKGYANGGSVNYNIAGVGQVGGNLTQGAMNEMSEALPKPKTYDEIKGDIQGFEFPELNTASTDPDSENYYGRKLQGDLFKQRQEKADLVYRPDQDRNNAYSNDSELQVLLRKAGVDSENFVDVMDQYKTGGNDLLGQGPSTLNEQLKNGLDALTDKRRMLRDGIKAEDIPEGATNRDMLKKIFFNEIDDFGAELDYDNYQANDKITGIINQDPDNFNPEATEEYKAAIKSYDLDGPADPQKLGYAASILDSDRGASAIPVKEDKGSGIMGEKRYVEGVGYVKAA